MIASGWKSSEAPDLGAWQEKFRQLMTEWKDEWI
jgi:hypothetical protein